MNILIDNKILSPANLYITDSLLETRNHCINLFGECMIIPSIKAGIRHQKDYVIRNIKAPTTFIMHWESYREELISDHETVKVLKELLAFVVKITKE